MANSNESPKDTEGGGAEAETGKEGHGDDDNDNDDVEGEKMLTQTDNGGGSSPSSPITAAGKRGRIGADGVHIGSSDGSGSGGASGRKAMKKREMEVPSANPICYVCKKVYASWKAVFGHLRSHQRQTPGAFPPPLFTPPGGSPEKNKNDVEALKDQLAPTLLSLAYEAMRKMSHDSNNTSVAAGSEGASSSRSGMGRTLDIDLNQPTTSFMLDLNEPPPPEQEDDDDQI